MTDDELVDRLRRTLRERAEGLEPGPAAVPVGAARPPGAALPAEAPGAPSTPAVAPVTGEYPTVAAGRPPSSRRPPGPGRGRRRWAAAVLAGALVAAGVAAAVVLSSGRHPATVVPAGPGPSTPPTSPAPAATAATAPPGTAPRPSTTASPGAAAVPAGFQPQSVTFVSSLDGWVVGWAPGRCALVARTGDGGRTWSAAGGPPLAAACGSTASPADRFEIRFADPADGWIYARTGTDQMRATLWSTHDGGLTWTSSVPLAGGSIDALEASAGQVHMVVAGPCPPGGAGCQGQPWEEILTSPATAERWTPAPLRPSVGAAPELSPELTLWGTRGWLVNDNRTVVSGARLVPGTGWAPWTPACSRSDGPGLVAAASAADLVAVCAEGAWGVPDAGTTAGTTWLFRSSDAGSSFSAAGAVPGGPPLAVATPPGDPRTVVVAAGTGGLQATFDGGARWSAVSPAGAGTWFGYVGFTTSAQGVAVTTGTDGATAVYMTVDGGRHWQPVRFGP